MTIDPSALDSAITAHLAQALGMSATDLLAAEDQDLEQLGMDSHSLMRCTLDVEAQFSCTNLSIPDEALETPRTLIAALGAAVLAQHG